MPGICAPDLITMIASIIVFSLIARMKEHDAKKQIVIIGIQFILGFIEIVSLAVAEMKPLNHQGPSMEGLGMSLTLSVLFLVAALFHLRNLRVNGANYCQV